MLKEGKGERGGGMGGERDGGMGGMEGMGGKGRDGTGRDGREDKKRLIHESSLKFNIGAERRRDAV